jgi:hypothetical protein
MQTALASAGTVGQHGRPLATAAFSQVTTLYWCVLLTAYESSCLPFCHISLSDPSTILASPHATTFTQRTCSLLSMRCIARSGSSVRTSLPWRTPQISP